MPFMGIMPKAISKPKSERILGSAIEMPLLMEEVGFLNGVRMVQNVFEIRR